MNKGESGRDEEQTKSKGERAKYNKEKRAFAIAREREGGLTRRTDKLRRTEWEKESAKRCDEIGKCQWRVVNDEL